MIERPPYKSPLALDRAVADRIKALIEVEAARRGWDARQKGARASQLRLDLAMQRAFARLERAHPKRWVLKGGAALQLRLDPSRASRDLDIVDSGDAVRRELQVRDLIHALEIDLGDFLTFEPRRETEDLEQDGSMTIPFDVRVGGKVFTQFSIDLAPPGAAVDSEMVSMSIPFDLPLRDATVQLRVLRADRQIAEKVCAMFERHKGEYSSRWRDLADIAMMAEQIPGLEAEALRSAISSEAARRAATLPDGLPAFLDLPAVQVELWRRQWGTGGREVPLGLDDALRTCQQLLDPLLDAIATGAMPIVATDERS